MAVNAECTRKTLGDWRRQSKECLNATKAYSLVTRGNGGVTKPVDVTTSELDGDLEYPRQAWENRAKPLNVTDRGGPHAIDRIPEAKDKG